jgi:hypothetical protein
VYHRIGIGEALPIRQPLRLLLAKQAEVGKMLTEIQHCGVIEESSSSWSSHVILVWKIGDLRFYIDQRKLNDVTRKDYFPVPRIDSTLGMLTGAKWFTTLDL